VAYVFPQDFRGQALKTRRLMHGNAKMARAKARHGNVLILDKLIMRCEGDELFLYQGGRRIAKRGHSGTRHAGQWLPLEPGIDVREVRKGDERILDVVYSINSWSHVA
jgi:hypothetical protein